MVINNHITVKVCLTSLHTSMLKLAGPKRSLLFQFPPWLSLSSLSHRSSFISSSLNSLNPHHRLSSGSSLPLPPTSFQLDSQNAHIPHAFLIKNGLESISFVSTDILLTYFTDGQFSIAQILYRILFGPNIRLLNFKLKELSDAGFFEKILDLYSILRLSDDAKPDNFTFPYVLKACASIVACEEGRSIHSQIVKFGFEDNIFVANSLIDVYSKSGSLDSAREAFDGMPIRNLVSWNSMISGYGLNGFPDKALELCNQMRLEGMGLDKVGLKIVLPVCGQLGEICLGKSVHAHIIIMGLSSDTILVTAVMDMYAKCRNLDMAERLFDEILHKDVVSWNSMISGYSKSGELEMVLKFFHNMQIENVRPSVVTVLITLEACADLANLLHVGETIHGYITKLGVCSEASIEALLINMYSKCGKLNLAYRVFGELMKEDLNSWTAMIHGLGMHGHGVAALMGFFKMLKRGIDPDDLCFLLILSCCSHTGLLNQGCKVFYYMFRQFGIPPNMEHYATMIDLMGRAGLIDEAFTFIRQMPLEPDISVWGAFLGACRIHSDFKMVKLSRDELLQLDPKTSGYYKLLLSIYASKGSWDEVSNIRNFMEEKVRKASGCSLIEINL